MLEWMTNNWSVKLLSVAIAMALWVFVTGQEKSEIILQMPVETTNVPKGLMVVGEQANLVEVRVRGAGTLVRTAATQPLTKVVDLRGSRAGEVIFDVEPDDLKLPPGVTAIRITPASIRIQLAKVAKRSLPVRPVLPGSPQDGYRLGEISIKPDKVTATGTAEDVAQLERWVWTRPIDINGISRTLTVKVPLRLVWAKSSKTPRRVALSPREVKVVIPIIALEPDKPRPKRPPAPQVDQEDI